MTQTTKSPRMVLAAAFKIAKQSLPAYAHRCSPRKFTQHQLFACLVLQQFLKLDYRKLQAFLLDTPCLTAVIELNTIPHFTTFQKAASRLLKSSSAQRLLDKTIRKEKRGQDSFLQCNQINWEFSRSATTVKEYPTPSLRAFLEANGIGIRIVP